jgi:hypothetical protein
MASKPSRWIRFTERIGERMAGPIEAWLDGAPDETDDLDEVTFWDKIGIAFDVVSILYYVFVVAAILAGITYFFIA